MRIKRVLSCSVVTGLVLASGCSSPLSRHAERELRAAVRESVRRALADAEAHSSPRTTSRESSLESLGLSEEVLKQLQTDYDPERYLEELASQVEGAQSEGAEAIKYLLSDDFFGRQPEILAVSLERAIKATVRHNLDVELARFGPAQREADVVAALAAFDWAFVGTLDWQDTDNPRGS
ncbi:MAG: hypothetical protein D6695_10135, partial [Planctomycetota bacterium]